MGANGRSTSGVIKKLSSIWCNSLGPVSKGLSSWEADGPAAQALGFFRPRHCDEMSLVWLCKLAFKIKVEYEEERAGSEEWGKKVATRVLDPRHG